jgi:hypothetical protein
LACLAAFSLTAGVMADDSIAEPPRITIHGLTAFEFGQLVKGGYMRERGSSYDYNHSWLSRLQSNIIAEARINSFLKVRAGLEAEYLTAFRQEETYNKTTQGFYNVYSTEAQGIFTFPLSENQTLSFGIGQFEVKYNPEARDLGEYLFRSTPYPQTLWTSFDFAMVRLLGLHIDHQVKSFDQHLYLHTSYDQFPFWDWSLSYLFSAGLLKKSVTLGGGFSLHHLLSVYAPFTRPQYGAQNPRLNTMMKYYVDKKGDTLIIPFAGTKLMGRATLDPKRLFLSEGGSGILGSEDAKLYAEINILGTTNYPSVYDSMYRYDKPWERIPIVLGFNIPTFKLLDVLSYEIEFWNNPYPNSIADILYSNETSPGVIQKSGYQEADYRGDNFKWALYFKKTMFNSFQIIGLAANDHFFTRNPDMDWTDYEQALRDKGDWMWMLKFRYLF